MKIILPSRFLSLVILLIGCQLGAFGQNQATNPVAPANRVTIGIERLVTPEFLPHLQNRRVAILTNHTGVMPDRSHLVDMLHARPEVKVVKLFSPEHGIRGQEDNHVADATDPKTGLKIISLYGKVRKPTPEMLQDVDVLLFDIQDVGARYYTYIATMASVLEAAAENKKPLLVLDRPNPITGIYVDGGVGTNAKQPVTGPNYLPIVHGMTVGELARMFNGERAAKKLSQAELVVVPMRHYTRNQWFEQTGLPWVKPSPNMLNLTTATLYPATCILEGTNVSEGRGTMQPFEFIGTPWIDGEKLARQLNSYKLAGVTFKPIQFKPDSVVDGIRIYPPKFVGQTCYGVQAVVTDRNTFESAKASVYIMHALKTLYPTQLEWKNSRLDGLWKTDITRKQLQAGETPQKIVSAWADELKYFRNVRAKYLLYP
ncbi:exo-beta-N-acetylmuramidase NamZ family protein [Rufibacter immobilis]|uniref:exo-beta-N-acetylmuramidase NamZ family protein n=1 Tax=Rufibacter immobilis TaxID=1348778 RepID=UPI0035E6B8B9